MTIATVDDIVAGLASGPQKARMNKTLTAPKGLGAFHSAWMAPGNPPAGSASPAYTAGSGYTCDKNTVGAAQLTNGAVKLWLAKLLASSTQPGTLIIYDRLWSCSNIGPAASTFTVTTPGALPARITDNGIGCELWIEMFVASAGTTGTVTAAYVNPDGAAKNGVFTMSTITSSPVAGQMMQIPLAAGDNGIKQLTSLTLSNTWTSGTLGATILKPIAEFPIAPLSSGSSVNGLVLDWAQLGLPEIANDACLTFMWFASNTTAPIVFCSGTLIDK